MKKVLILIFGIALFACTQESGFKINVSLDGAEGVITLANRVNGEWNVIDSAEVVDGKAVFEGEVPYPGVYYVGVEGQRSRAMVFVENSEFSMTGKADSLRNVNVVGSSTHDEFAVVNSKLEEINKEYMAVYQEIRKASAAKDEAKVQELSEKMNALRTSMTDVQEDFVANNPASYVAPYFVERTQYGKSAEELEAMVDALDPTLANVQTVISLKERIAKLKAVAIGQIAPDFTQNDADGNPVKFSDIYSKHELTLLDFWASWCGPCRRENPNVVAVFNDYSEKGFHVFGVSLDNDKDKWLKAIEDDQLNWDHVSDLGGWGNVVAGEYAIRSIPSSLLVDKTGKIIAKDKREEALRETVAEFFEK